MSGTPQQQNVEGAGGGRAQFAESTIAVGTTYPRNDGRGVTVSVALHTHTHTHPRTPWRLKSVDPSDELNGSDRTCPISTGDTSHNSTSLRPKPRIITGTAGSGERVGGAGRAGFRGDHNQGAICVGVVRLTCVGDGAGDRPREARLPDRRAAAARCRPTELLRYRGCPGLFQKEACEGKAA